jgi:anti-sigma factor RsiW
MECSQIDCKAYALGDLPTQEQRAAAVHVTKCEDCREAVAGLRLTLAALSGLREEEPTRRIAFVSDRAVADKAAAPSWWQPLLHPTFASACLVAAAIVFHAFSGRGSNEAEVQARIDRAVAHEMEVRMEVLDQQDRRNMQVLKVALGLKSY